jgi:hypothetical protein
VLCRRLNHGLASAEIQPGSGKLSFKSGQDINISERDGSRAGTGNGYASAFLRTPSG